jgi:hypothetical protein
MNYLIVASVVAAAILFVTVVIVSRRLGNAKMDASVGPTISDMFDSGAKTGIPPAPRSRWRWIRRA